ncbi:hypothetical protein [Clostridium transplantifaecale]|uniref:hypothetical protein n=1 Tax=Clostridium transplantifaecale TaxID=2479838 RepID=UPI000F63DB2B|nr:hypothetical protein [Clostridium transplantifaecale]
MGIIGSFQGMVDSPYYLMKPGTISGSSRPILSPEMYYFPSVVVETTRGYNEDDWNYSSFKLWFKLGNDNSAGAYRLMKFNQVEISFAAYSKLYVKLSSTAWGNTPTYQRIGISSSGAVTGNSFQAYIDPAVAISGGLYELNISSLNGTYWIYLWQQLPGTGSRGASGSVLTFNEIYLVA